MNLEVKLYLSFPNCYYLTTEWNEWVYIWHPTDNENLNGWECRPKRKKVLTIWRLTATLVVVPYR